jgi:ArsR family transcriptional regulator
MVVMPPAARLKKPAPAPALPEDKTFELADMFKMLGDPTRLRIVIATLEGPVAVSDIAERLGLSLSLVSHHLRLLRAARLVTPDRRGKQIFYRIHDQHVAHVIADMIAHVNEDAE